MISKIPLASNRCFSSDPISRSRKHFASSASETYPEKGAIPRRILPLLLFSSAHRTLPILLLLPLFIEREKQTFPNLTMSNRVLKFDTRAALLAAANSIKYESILSERALRIGFFDNFLPVSDSPRTRQNSTSVTTPVEFKKVVYDVTVRRTQRALH
jgi:hypothetical protein